MYSSPDFKCKTRVSKFDLTLQIKAISTIHAQIFFHWPKF